MKGHIIRLVVASVIGVSLMLFLLLMAVKYAQRDWSKKNQRAKASRTQQASAPVVEMVDILSDTEGWTYELPPAATPRTLDRLARLPEGPNAWLLLGRGLPDKSESDLVIAALRMAMATDGESAIIKNDMGAAYLQKMHLRKAIAQFHAADQLQPGFAPARYNLALCAISRREPAQAVKLLGQYLGQRPLDSSALRLQATLLTQLGDPEKALHMLEKYLISQPADEPLFLEAATLAARLEENGNAIRYLETAMNGNPIQTVIRTYQSPTFRSIRLSGEGEALTARMAAKARATFSTAVPQDEIRPLRSGAPKAIVH
jgi:tetratricopeptide (TPR) repeat protein